MLRRICLSDGTCARHQPSGDRPGIRSLRLPHTHQHQLSGALVAEPLVSGKLQHKLTAAVGFKMKAARAGHSNGIGESASVGSASTSPEQDQTNGEVRLHRVQAAAWFEVFGRLAIWKTKSKRCKPRCGRLKSEAWTRRTSSKSRATCRRKC